MYRRHLQACLEALDVVFTLSLLYGVIETGVIFLRSQIDHWFTICDPDDDQQEYVGLPTWLQVTYEQLEDEWHDLLGIPYRDHLPGGGWPWRGQLP